MKLFTILHTIWNHPFNKNYEINAIIRFLKWQFFSSVTNYTILYPLTNNSIMLAKKGMTGVTGCIYNGLFEFDDMMFLLHFLRKEDVFVDIGSNVGVYTILASAEIGARVIAFEPIKDTFNVLQQNVNLNKVESIVNLYNIGIGDRKGRLNFSTLHDTTNHVINENELITIEHETIEVDTLDNILSDIIPNLIKIDVEGFEYNVIKGGENIFSNPNLKALIVELNGSGIKYGFNDTLLHNKILSFGFEPYSYEPYKRILYKIDKFGSHNTIYIKDYKFVNEKIQNANKISILNKQI